MSEDRNSKRETFNRLRTELGKLGAVKPAGKIDPPANEVGSPAPPRGAGRTFDVTREQLRQLVSKQKSSRGPSLPPPELTPKAASCALRYPRSVTRTEKPVSRLAAAPEEIIPLAEAVPGGNEVEGKAGRYYFIEKATSMLEGAEDVARAFRAAYEDRDHPLHKRLRQLTDSDLPSVEEVVFMDLETTGLSSSPLFLIGLMEWDRGCLQVRQLLARNYAEERAVLNDFSARLTRKRMLVTFNGKSYDWPYVQVRAAATGVRIQPSAPAHLDLLHEGRRLWRERLQLPDCKLQTLEWHVCERMRYGDIPGSQIPDAYHAYVRTGHAADIAKILEHNVFDLVTMADLMSRFPD